MVRPLAEHTRTFRPVEVGYVLVIAALAATAMSDPNDPRLGLWLLTLALTLPAAVPMLPATYLAAAIAWGLTGADSGGPAWPVTLTYVLAAAATAVVNVVLLRWLLARRDAGHFA